MRYLFLDRSSKLTISFKPNTGHATSLPKEGKRIGSHLAELTRVGAFYTENSCLASLPSVNMTFSSGCQFLGTNLVPLFSMRFEEHGASRVDRVPQRDIYVPI
jgi:hypothetical protein